MEFEIQMHFKSESEIYLIVRRSIQSTVNDFNFTNLPSFTTDRKSIQTCA